MGEGLRSGGGALRASSCLPPWDFLGGAGVFSSMNPLSREWRRGEMCAGVEVMKAGPLGSERGEMCAGVEVMKAEPLGSGRGEVMGELKPKSEGGDMGTSSSVPNREETAVAAFRNIWRGAED